MQKPASKFYSRQDVAGYLGVSVQTIDRLIKDGELPCVQVRDRVLIAPAALDEFIEQNTKYRG